MKSLALVTLLLAPLSAHAVVGTTARSAGEGSNLLWTGVGQMNGASAVAVGPNLILTAAHVGAGDFFAAGESYTMTGSELAPKVGKNTVDLRLVSVSETLPTWYALGSPTKKGQSVTMVGFGGGGYVDAAGKGYVVTGGGNQTIGTNVLSDKGTTKGTGPTVRARLKKAGDSALTVGDSGGGWFVNGKLVGISSFVYSTNSKKANYGFDKKGYFGSGAIDLTDKTLRKWLDARIAAGFLPTSMGRSIQFDGKAQPVPEPATLVPFVLVAAIFARRRK